MVIDTQSSQDRITLTVDMDKEDFVLYQVATPHPLLKVLKVLAKSTPKTRGTTRAA